MTSILLPRRQWPSAWLASVLSGTWACLLPSVSMWPHDAWGYRLLGVCLFQNLRLGVGVQPCSSLPLPAGAGTSCSSVPGNYSRGVLPPSALPQSLLRGCQGALLPQGLVLAFVMVTFCRPAKSSSKTLEQESGTLASCTRAIGLVPSTVKGGKKSQVLV